jgi:hypothetical protein
MGKAMTLDDIIARACAMRDRELDGAEDAVRAAGLAGFILAVFVDVLADGLIADPQSFALELRAWFADYCSELEANPHVRALEERARSYSPVANAAPIAEVDRG